MKYEENWIGLIAPIKDGRCVIKTSGTPHPRRNASGIFPCERTSVSMPTVLGPSWWYRFQPLDLRQIHVGEVRTSAPGPVEIGPDEAGLAEVGPVEVGPAEVGPVEVSKDEGGPAEVGPAEVGPAEGGPAKVGLAEVGPAEVGPDEVGPAEVGLTERRNLLARLPTPIPFCDPFQSSLEQPQCLVAVHSHDLPATVDRLDYRGAWTWRRGPTPRSLPRRRGRTIPPCGWVGHQIPAGSPPGSA